MLPLRKMMATSCFPLLLPRYGSRGRSSERIRWSTRQQWWSEPERRRASEKVWRQVKQAALHRRLLYQESNNKCLRARDDFPLFRRRTFSTKDRAHCATHSLKQPAFDSHATLMKLLVHPRPSSISTWLFVFFLGGAERAGIQFATLLFGLSP